MHWEMFLWSFAHNMHCVALNYALFSFDCWYSRCLFWLWHWQFFLLFPLTAFHLFKLFFCEIICKSQSTSELVLSIAFLFHVPQLILANAKLQQTVADEVLSSFELGLLFLYVTFVVYLRNFFFFFLIFREVDNNFTMEHFIWKNPNESYACMCVGMKIQINITGGLYVCTMERSFF